MHGYNNYHSCYYPEMYIIHGVIILMLVIRSLSFELECHNNNMYIFGNEEIETFSFIRF